VTAGTLTVEALRSARIALVGPPNSGKTTLFNTLTGGRQKTANYPGVTVERKSGLLRTPDEHSVEVLDLPGSYSLRARSPDEAITRDVVLGRQQQETLPDAIVCVTDATNLNQHLRLLLELRPLGRPLILALNMMDIAQKRGCRIDIDALSRELGIPVVTTVAMHKSGVQNLLGQIDALLRQRLASDGARTIDGWQEPSVDAIRAYHREVERVLRQAMVEEGTPARFTRQLDRVLLHPIAGPVILLALLFLMFQAVFSWAATPMDWIDGGMVTLQQWLNAHMEESLLKSLLVDGIVAGVGGVVIFLPQILILFLFILLLEDSGYMTRAAFLMDRLMSAAGLNGRAFIPLLSSFACAVPGIMATRAISHPLDRLVTILIAPLMTCSARLPVYVLLIAAFIPDTLVWGSVGLQGLVMFGVVRNRHHRRLGGGGCTALNAAERWPPAIADGIAKLQMAQSGQRTTRLVGSGQNLPAADRYHYSEPDGHSLVSLDLSGTAGRGDGAGDLLQFRRHDRAWIGTAAGAHRLQLANRHCPGARASGARGSCRGARYGLRSER
jgi:ferrous iron transport protein B